MSILRIEPLPGYSAAIGRLVCMLTYVRETLIATVRDLGPRELDHRHDAASNSIGALLSHAVAVERYYQLFTFEGREPSPEEEARWSAALDLGEAGRRCLRGHDLPWYLAVLAATRKATLAALAERDDAVCPNMWAVKDEAADVLSYWDAGGWQDRSPDSMRDVRVKPPS